MKNIPYIIYAAALVLLLACPKSSAQVKIARGVEMDKDGCIYNIRYIFHKFHLPAIALADLGGLKSRTGRKDKVNP